MSAYYKQTLYCQIRNANGQDLLIFCCCFNMYIFYHAIGKVLAHYLIEYQRNTRGWSTGFHGFWLSYYNINTIIYIYKYIY
jgi:hypothetical protein